MLRPNDALPAIHAQYRWVIVVIASLAMAGTLPGRTHGLGLITKPLLEDLRITEVLFGALNFWAIVVGAAFCFPVGRIVDRFGSRGVLTIVSAVLGIVVILTGFVSGPWTLFAALVLSRGLGQGALSVISTAMIGKWFTRHVGPAMGVFAVLLAIGFIVGVLGVGAAIQSHGWRLAWQQLGCVLLFGLAPIGWLGIRSTPESCDLQVEGVGHDVDTAERRIDLDLRAALASPAFWVFTSASCLFGFIWSGITLYNEFILAGRGFGRDEFYQVMAIITGAGLLANLAGGWMATRWPLGRLLGLGMTLLAASLLAFPLVRTNLELIGYACTLGIAAGLITVVHFTFYPQAFGRTHLGQIQGFFQVLSIFTSALGPLALAWCKEWCGSYEALFLAVAPLSLALAAAAVWTRMPVRPPQ